MRISIDRKQNQKSRLIMSIPYFKDHMTDRTKSEKVDELYKKYFEDHPSFRNKCYRRRDDYIFYKDEAYACIYHYIETGIEP